MMKSDAIQAIKGQDLENRSVTATFKGHAATDGAGVRMTRVIGTSDLDNFDPFLLLDEFRSDDPDDYIAGFPDHPHRGFETVTYMLAGAMQHRDNRGNAGLLGPGSVQWMTAGRGIVHSEMPQQEDGLMWGFQLWVNLPARQKMIEPRYQEFAAEEVPAVAFADDVTIKIIAGEVAGVSGPVRDVPTEPYYVDVHISAEKTTQLPVPRNHNAFVYVYAGEIKILGRSPQHVARGQIALLGPGDALHVHAEAETRFLVIGGKPIAEPIARYGPFVMNTRAELQQAFADYQAAPASFGSRSRS